MKQYNLYFLLMVQLICFSVIQGEQLSPAAGDAIIMQSSEQESYKKYNRANTTIIIYMAADNDLRSFAARNIKQMAEVGSNEHLHIAVHLDIRIAGNKKITRRYYVAGKDSVLHMNANDPDSQMMDSGQKATLISACKWAIQNFPADEYVLVFWNHGTGIIDPTLGKIINPTELFSYNPRLNLLELDRSTSILGNIHQARHRYDANDLLMFLDDYSDNDLLVWQELEQNMQNIDDPKGICWDDSTGNYLTNQKLDEALSTIRANYLGNKKFSIIGFDACLMSMLEIATILEKHADIMVGSQEVELGTGWNYQKVLEPFKHKALGKKDFARHIVRAYEDTYNKITNDYTQSAIDLSTIASLEDNLSSIAQLLIQALEIQQNKSVTNALRASKSKLLCTHFDESTYIDLHHFYRNLEQNLYLFSFTHETQGKNIIANIKPLLVQGKSIIEKVVFANSYGKNLSQAKGISIYFPDRIHSSYAKSSFAMHNKWFQMLQAYVAS